MNLWDFLPELTDALEAQLKSDALRYGDTWLTRTREGQEDRTIVQLADYFDQWKATRTPIPWLKVIGHAMICWIREKHKEIWPK